MSQETLLSYLEGPDPQTGRVVVEEIVEALTKPVRSARTGLRADTERCVAPAPFLAPGREDELQRRFWENGWTDGLPVILPTRERVQKMLAGTCRTPDEGVGEVVLRNTKEIVSFTVTNIAVIAVMAGARPEHFPLILAIASTGESALMPSTTPFASMLVVNGPIRREIGMNGGLAAFSPLNLANSVIGRAWTLMSIIWGFGQPKKTLWSAQGSNLIFNNMCAAENEERSVWRPFHVQKGYKAEESVVSIFRGWNVLNSLHAAAHRSVGEEINIQLGAIPALDSKATIILDPTVARNLKENEGFGSKEDFARWLSANVKIPAGRYWGTDYIDMLAAPLASRGIEPYASWKKAADDELIPHYHNPDNINLLVMGGETSPLWKTTDYGYVSSTSVDKWRPKKSGEDCQDGKCGPPDEPADYD
jgi:hypothetical protein